MDQTPKGKQTITQDEAIVIDDDDDDLPELLHKEEIHPPHQVKRTSSGKIDINSMLLNNETSVNKDGNSTENVQVIDDANEEKKEVEQSGPKRRKPRAVKKKEEPEPGSEKPKPKPKRAPRVTKKAKEAAEAKAKKEAEEAAAAEEEANKKVVVQNAANAANAANVSKVDSSDATTIEAPKEISKDSPSTNPSQISLQPTPIIGNTTPKPSIPLTNSSGSTPINRSPLSFSKPNDIMNLVNNDDNTNDNIKNQPQLLPSALPNESTKSITIIPTNPSQQSPVPLSNNTNTTTPATGNNINNATTTGNNSNSTTTATPKSRKNTKKTAAEKESKTKANENKETKPKSKAGPKKSDSKKSTTPQHQQQKPPEPPVQPLTQDQINNQNLIKPDPKLNASLPLPKVIEIQNQHLQSPKGSPKQSQSQASPKQSISQETTPQPDGTKPTEPIIALHVPLTLPNSSNSSSSSSSPGPKGATQVVFNVLKMAEDKYGWKNLHPEASKYSLELMNDEDIDDDEDDEDDEKDEKDEDDQPDQNAAPQQAQQPQRIDGRKLQKGKPKIGQYDKEDPFIDDSEMVWEEQRASTKDGFFVFYGPLIEEGKSAKIERADGTIKRSRKRVAGQSGNTGGGNGGGNGAGNGANANGPANKKRAINPQGSTGSKQTTPKLISIAPAGGGNGQSSNGQEQGQVTQGKGNIPIDIAPKVQ